MRGRRTLLFLILLPAIVLGPLSSAEAGEASLAIVGVMPRYGTEVIVLHNPSPFAVDLRGWSLSDGEGSVTFPSLVLEGDAFLDLVDGDPEGLGLGTVIMEDGPGMERRGALTLADRGDEVMLLSPSGTVVDAIVYGDCSPGEGWRGPPCPRPGRGEALLRCGGDSDRAEDWAISALGRSGLPRETFIAQVEPFLLPDSGEGMMAREIHYATRSVDISLYQFDSPSLASLLAKRAEEGVRVRMLLEGSPVGGMDDDTLGTLAALCDGGCDVRLMRSADGYRRYDCLHSKYAVFDGRRCMVTSENWNSALLENRGWGAAIASVPLCEMMQSLFEEDISPRLDVVPFREVFPDVPGVELPPPASPCPPEHSFTCQVEPVVTPEHSSFLLPLLSSARERLYIEQLYCQEEWAGGWLGDALGEKDAVDVRVLLDSSWFSLQEGRDNAEAVASFIERGVRARLVSDLQPFSLLHNKGVVADDQVLISSINFGDAALHRNREVGMLIHSPAMADLFASSFLQDWSVDPLPPDLEYSVTVEGNVAILDATGTWDASGNVTVRWDIDGEVVEGPFHIIPLPPGPHSIAVTAVDGEGNSAMDSTEVCVRTSSQGKLPLHLPAVAALAAFAAWRAVKKLKGR